MEILTAATGVWEDVEYVPKIAEEAREITKKPSPLQNPCDTSGLDVRYSAHPLGQDTTQRRPTMRKLLIGTAVAFAFVCFTPAPAALAVDDAPAIGMHRLGFGANYWKTIDDVDDPFDRDGLSFLVSYQVAPVWFFKVEADLEIFPDLAESSDVVLAPELFVTFGGLVYGGVGIGIYFTDGDWGDSPFYMLRAGLDFPILPRLFLDVNANYRFNDWDSISWNAAGNPDTDTIRLGAALRFVL